MTRMVPFRYSGFYDVPLGIVLRYHDRLFLLLSEFDEERDEYSESYSVYVLPDAVEKQIERGSWHFIGEGEKQYIGEVKVAEIKFDETKRKELDASVLDRLL